MGEAMGGGFSDNKKDYLFQKDAFVEKFRPLSYYEIATGKPIMVPIPNSKYVFRSEMHSVTALYRFAQMSHLMIKPIEDAMTKIAEKTAVKSGINDDSVSLIRHYVGLAKILWDMATLPKNPIIRFLMWRKYIKAVMDDSFFLFNLLGQFRDYQHRFFFIMKSQVNYKVHQEERWQAIHSTTSAEDPLTRIRRRGLSFSPAERLKKLAQSAHMN